MKSINPPHATDDPYDRLLTSRPIRAARAANALVVANPRIYAFGFVLTAVAIAINLGSSSGSIPRWVLSRGIGLLFLPILWLSFYSVVLKYRNDHSESVTDTLLSVKGRCLSFIGTHLLVRGCYWITGVVVFLGTLAGGLYIIGYISGSAGPSLRMYNPSSVARVAFISGVLGLAVATVVSYYLQFADLEIVLRGNSPISALRESRNLVRENHRAVFGYFLVRASIFGFTSLPIVVIPGVNALSSVNPELVYLVAGTVVMMTLVINTLLIPFIGTYHVEFYYSLRE